jgi:hypothetical protein
MARKAPLNLEMAHSTCICQWLVAPVGLLRVLHYLGLSGKTKSDLEKAKRDHVLKEGLVSSIMRNLLLREHGMIEAKGRLPFGGSCMVAARKK